MFYVKQELVHREFQCISALCFQEIQLVFNSQFLDTYWKGSCGLHEPLLSDFSQRFSAEEVGLFPR